MNDLRVQWAKDGQKALQLMQQFSFDLCLLDIMLPDIDGFEIAKRIKDVYPDMPFIFLTAKALKVDKLMGYKLGGVDYITKPVDEELLIAKIRALLNRLNPSSSSSFEQKIYALGNYEFDFSRQCLLIQEDRHQLTNKEAQLLKLLCDHQNQLVSREKALKLLWGKNDEFNRKTMDVFIFKLRKYLKADARVKITNVHGKGFVLEVQ